MSTSANASALKADLAEQAQLAVFVEHAPAEIAMFDREMRYLAVSRRYVIDFRLPADAQLIGKSHYEAFPEIPQRWRDIPARVLAGEELSNGADQFTRRDGRTEWTGWSMAPWRGGDGRIGGALLFAEVRTEQVVARRALADSRARFRATFENAAVGVAIVDTEGSILRANNSFARMLGYSVEELTTRTFQDLTHPDDLAKVPRCSTRRSSAKPKATALRSATSARMAVSFGQISTSVACERRAAAYHT